jgi:hypothetical protein
MQRTADSAGGDAFLGGEAFLGGGDGERTFFEGEPLLGGGEGDRPFRAPGELGRQEYP